MALYTNCIVLEMGFHCSVIIFFLISSALLGIVGFWSHVTLCPTSVYHSKLSELNDMKNDELRSDSHTETKGDFIDQNFVRVNV